MSRFQRVLNVAVGLVSILLGVILILFPVYGFDIILLILSAGLFVLGIKEIIYYFSMAIHMVGGKRSLYKGVIVLEVALFTLSMYEMPTVFVLLYLIAIHAFSGGVEVMRAMEARKNGTSSYKLKLSHGIIDLLMAVCCLVFIKHGDTAVYIYSAGLIYSAIIKIITAFKRTAVVYIQ